MNNESKEPNFEEASHESEMSNVTDTGMSKPKISYAGLISEALLNSPNGMLILSDIYESISARHPYYQMNVPGWQNSIRHNLTLNKSFVKCTDGLKKANDGKYSNYWKLSENLSKSVMKKLSKAELSKIQSSLGKNCYVKSKTSFDLMCKNCYQTFVNPYQLNEHSCHEIKQEPQEIMESVIEGSQNDQKVGFQSIKIELLTIKQTQMSDIADPLLMCEIKMEHLEENEATPTQDLTAVYIKQEEFDTSEYQNGQENGMMVQEIKEEFVLGE
jgi:protein-arginine kinase activator protein McsA